MRVLLVGLVCAAMATPTAIAGAAEVVPPGGLSGGTGAAAPPLALSPAELVKPAGAADDLLSYARTVRRLQADAFGETPIDWRQSTTQAAAAAQAEGEAAGGGTVRSLLRPSDLTGDGIDDPGFFEILYDADIRITRVAVTTLDGRSGSVLWTRDYGVPYDLIVLSPGDLTGDGAGDLLVTSLRQGYADLSLPCITQACVFDYKTTLRWDVALLSGKDGKPVWERGFDGSAENAGVQVLGAPATTFVRDFTVVNAAIDIRRAPDRNGDGLADLILNAYDLKLEEVRSGAGQSRSVVQQVTTRAEVVGGVTGSVLLTRNDANRLGGGAQLTSAGKELLWTTTTSASVPRVCIGFDCTSGRRARTTIELVGGWTQTFDDTDLEATAPLLSVGDRILVGQYVADASPRLLALDRATGEEVWRTDTLLTDPPSALGDGELMLWEGEDVSEPGVDYRIRLRRVSAASGAQRLLTTRALETVDGSSGIIYAYPLDDVDGDGVDDIAHAEWHNTVSTPGVARTQLEVESGATGAPVFTGERDRNALLFDGNARGGTRPARLLEASLSWGNLDFRLGVVEVSSGRTLWERTEKLTTANFGAGADLDGGRVVYARGQGFGGPFRWRSRVDMLRVTTGRQVWGHGDTGFPDVAPEEPAAEASPTPVVSPTPDPVLSPTPDPVLTPTPDPVLSPTPDPVLTPTPDPRGTPAPETTAVPPAPARTPAPAASPAPTTDPRATAPRASARIVRRSGRTLTVQVTCACSGRVVVTRRGRRVGSARFARAGLVRVRIRAGRGPLRVRVDRMVAFRSAPR